MKHALTLAGWLLITYYGVTVPTVYETEKDCDVAAQYYRGGYSCVPDGPEVRSWQGKAQP